jgi:hypothetical protein
MDDRPTTYSTCTGRRLQGASILWVAHRGRPGSRSTRTRTRPGTSGSRRCDDGTIRGVVLTGAQLPAPDGVLVYRPHHQHLPRRSQSSAGGRPRPATCSAAAATAPVARGCSTAAASWHINCEPVTAADAGVVLTPMPTPPLERKARRRRPRRSARPRTVRHDAHRRRRSATSTCST